jgi:uncharacterized protein
MPRMVEVTIDSVRVSLTNQQRIVVLREKGTDRYLPIWIGPYEAEAITISLQEVEVARPQTHDLLKNLLTSLNARLVRVEVVGLHEDVFYASLVLETQDQEVTVDSRPSDAIALAVRAHVPIFVSPEVMETASIAPELESSEETSSDNKPLATTTPAEKKVGGDGAEERLSVFEDFLKNLEKEPPPDTPPSEESDDDPDDGGQKK